MKLRGKKATEILGQTVLWVILIASLLIFSVPFFFMITNSFEEFSYVLPYPPKLFPTRLDFSAYRHILSMDIFPTALFTLMMPGFLNIIPQFLVLKQLTLPGLPNGLIGTRAGLILIYVATNVCGHTFFLRNFFRSLPSSLAESVLLDGGGHKDIFFRVMLPLSAPAVGTMTIFAFQGFWEEYFTAKVLVGANEKMITFPLLLQRLNGQYATRWEWVFAASIMALIPVIVLFVVFQRKTVVGGLTQGAVKG